MRRFLFLLAAVLVAVVAFWLWPRSSSPEEQVQAAVREMIEGARARDPGRVLGPVSERFHSSTLGDRTDLKRILLGQFLRGGGIEVLTLQADLRPEPDGRMRWVGRVAVARAGAEGLARLTDAELRQLQIDALFADEGGHWRAVEATVRPVE